MSILNPDTTIYHNDIFIYQNMYMNGTYNDEDLCDPEELDTLIQLYESIVKAKYDRYDVEIYGMIGAIVYRLPAFSDKFPGFEDSDIKYDQRNGVIRAAIRLHKDRFPCVVLEMLNPIINDTFDNCIVDIDT